MARVADVRASGAARFAIPFDAPSPLPAGDPGVGVRLANGAFVAFDAAFTHAGCTVEWDASTQFPVCPCHRATFAPARTAAVVGGPTDTHLSSLPIVMERATGSILLKT